MKSSKLSVREWASHLAEGLGVDPPLETMWDKASCPTEQIISKEALKHEILDMMLKMHQPPTASPHEGA